MTESQPQDSLPPTRGAVSPESFPAPTIPSPSPTPTARPVRAAYVPNAQTPIVTYTIMGLTVVIYVAQLITPFLFGYDLPAQLGMKENSLIAQGELWRLFTPMLLHGSILHILFNMYALRSFGPGLEQHYGHGRFLLLYLLAGFAGNVASLALSVNPSLGASTSLFGLFGAEGVFLYQNRELFGERARAALNQIVTLAVINLIIGLSIPRIDN